MSEVASAKRSTATRVRKLETDVEALKSGHKEMTRDMSELKRTVCVISQDLSELKSGLAQTATKYDVEHAVNGVIKDALAAVPQEQANVIATQADKTSQNANWIALGSLALVAISALVTFAHQFF